MHPGADEFVGRFATQDAVSVIEIGSRNINGTIRGHFPHADWLGLDLTDGPDVDVIADARTYQPVYPVDMVICCEVFEHTAYWIEIISDAFGWLKPGGTLIVTCAGPGREEHSADGGELKPTEWYRNISKLELEDAILLAGFTNVKIDSNEHWRDTYGTAMKALGPS